MKNPYPCKHDGRLTWCDACVSRCCKDGCGKKLSHPALPFCDEHMKDEELVKAWNEL